MTRIKIIASSISNLTDARYFAAWGVDALSFDLDIVDRDEYFAIKDWVEGVKIFMETKTEFSDLEIHEADGIIYYLDRPVNDTDMTSGKTKVSGSLAVLQSMSFPEGQILRAGPEWSSMDKKDQKEWIAFAKNNDCFIDIPLSLADLKNNIDNDFIYGIVLRGGDEEKVGFKSFDELDEIYDLLEES